MCLIIINKLINNSIIMNETMSLLMATTILALGGLGLYMYKNDDENENQKGGEEEYNEGSIFGSNFWGSNDDEENEEENVQENVEEEQDEYPRRRVSKSKAQTKRQKRTGGTKRRY